MLPLRTSADDTLIGGKYQVRYLMVFSFRRSAPRAPIQILIPLKILKYLLSFGAVVETLLLCQMLPISTAMATQYLLH